MKGKILEEEGDNEKEDDEDESHKKEKRISESGAVGGLNDFMFQMDKGIYLIINRDSSLNLPLNY